MSEQQTLFNKIANMPRGQRGDRQVVDLADVLVIIKEHQEQANTAPTYYILRRTVGVTTMHYEYLTRNHKWTTIITEARFSPHVPHDQHDHMFLCEIIPMKLMEV